MVQHFTYLINWCSSEAGLVSLGDTLASYKSTERSGAQQSHHWGGSNALESSGSQSQLASKLPESWDIKSCRVSDPEGVTREQHLHFDVSDKVPNVVTWLVWVPHISGGRGGIREGYLQQWKGAINLTRCVTQQVFYQGVTGKTEWNALIPGNWLYRTKASGPNGDSKEG